VNLDEKGDVLDPNNCLLDLLYLKNEFKLPLQYEECSLMRVEDISFVKLVGIEQSEDSISLDYKNNV